MSIKFQSFQRKLSGIQPEVVKVLQEVSATLVGTFDLDVLLQKIVETYQKISKASTCSIFLVDEEKNRLVMRAGVGYKKDLKGVAEYDLSVNPNTPGIGITAWIALTKQKFSAKTRQELISHPAWRGKYESLQYPGDKKCESLIGILIIVCDDDIERLLYIFLTSLTHKEAIGFNRAIYFGYQPITKRLIGKDGRYGHGARFNIILPVVV